MSDIRYFDKMRTSVVAPEPCIGCENYILCGEEELACRAFAYYVDHNSFSEDTPRMPDKKTYINIFADTDGQLKLL